MEFKGYDKNFGLNGKVALVTGSAKGIGKAISLLFAEKGADIIAVDMDDEVKKIAVEIEKSGRKCLPIIQNLTDYKKLGKIVEESINKFGKIDILVNNAGIAQVDFVENIPENFWDETMAVNAKAPFMLTQLVGKEMIKRKSGKIINIASIAGTIAFEKHAVYCASKAAMILFSRVFAIEWGKYGITVNTISPIVTLTEMGKTIWVGEVAKETLKTIPVGRFNYPEEIAAGALYFATDASNTVTGMDLVIDGGYSVK
jgi:NAD(P)-dependent dehydrogenase (short-subunit alcohol dehydrogenase family)